MNKITVELTEDQVEALKHLLGNEIAKGYMENEVSEKTAFYIRLKQRLADAKS